jgi:dTMP kinase
LAKKPLFISFEGVEGCGKSTQAQLLADWFKQQSLPVVLLHEPGSTPLGTALRTVLLDSELKITPKAEALLYAASRAQLVAEVISKALQQGKNVICDRYLDSSLAYQVYGRGLSFQEVLSVNEWATERLLPDLTFFLRLPVEVGLARVKSRRLPLDRLESEADAFHKRVEAGYEELAVKYSERYYTVAADAPVETVFQQIVQVVKQQLQP